jgi:hypothetical protein
MSWRTLASFSGETAREYVQHLELVVMAAVDRP